MIFCLKNILDDKTGLLNFSRKPKSNPRVYLMKLKKFICFRRRLIYPPERLAYT